MTLELNIVAFSLRGIHKKIFIGIFQNHTIYQMQNIRYLFRTESTYVGTNRLCDIDLYIWHHLYTSNFGRKYS